MPTHTSAKQHAPVLQCKVAGCTSDLQCDSHYAQSRRVCSKHIQAEAVQLHRGEQLHRFCMQCATFEPLTQFDGIKRTCRAKLRLRRSRRHTPSQGPSRAAGSGGRQARVRGEGPPRASCAAAGPRSAATHPVSFLQQPLVGGLPGSPSSAACCWPEKGLPAGAWPGAAAAVLAAAGGPCSGPCGQAGAAPASSDDEAFEAMLFDSLAEELALGLLNGGVSDTNANSPSGGGAGDGSNSSACSGGSMGAALWSLLSLGVAPNAAGAADATNAGCSSSDEESCVRAPAAQLSPFFTYGCAHGAAAPQGTALPVALRAPPCTPYAPRAWAPAGMPGGQAPAGPHRDPTARLAALQSHMMDLQAQLNSLQALHYGQMAGQGRSALETALSTNVGACLV